MAGGEKPPPPLTEAAVAKWERARVDPLADFAGPPPVRAVFAYGSLVFRPGFRFQRAYPACVRGFRRRFWQKSCDHRGTPERPGRVVTLVRAEDVQGEEEDAAARAGIVHGIAYEVADDEWDAVIEELDVRERYGYMRTVDWLYPVGENPAVEEPLARAVVYYCYKPQENAIYCGPESTEEAAAVIAFAEGPSGRNDAYCFALEAALRQHGLPPDPYLTDISRRVRAMQAQARQE